MENIHQFIKERRLEIKLSNQQLSNESGISTSYISRLEKGERFPSPQTLKKLAEPLQVSYVKLLKVSGMLERKGTNCVDLKHMLEKNICVFNEKELTEKDKENILSLLQAI